VPIPTPRTRFVKELRQITTRWVGPDGKGIEVHVTFNRGRIPAYSATVHAVTVEGPVTCYMPFDGTRIYSEPAARYNAKRLIEINAAILASFAEKLPTDSKAGVRWAELAA
jgi:hypothetical protein